MVTVLKLDETIKYCEERAYLGEDDLDATALKIMNKSRKEIPFVIMIIYSYIITVVFPRCILLEKSQIGVDISASESHVSSHLLHHMLVLHKE